MGVVSASRLDAAMGVRVRAELEVIVAILGGRGQQHWPVGHLFRLFHKRTNNGFFFNICKPSPPLIVEKPPLAKFG